MSEISPVAISPAQESRRAQLRARVRRRSPRGEGSFGLLKTVIGLVVVAIPVIDTTAVVIGRVNGGDRANEIARFAAESFQGNQNIDQAYQAAVEQGAIYQTTVDPATFFLDQDGKTIRLKAQHQAKTILAGRIEPLKKYTIIVSEGSGRPFA